MFLCRRFRRRRTLLGVQYCVHKNAYIRFRRPLPPGVRLASGLSQCLQVCQLTVRLLTGPVLACGARGRPSVPLYVQRRASGRFVSLDKILFVSLCVMIRLPPTARLRGVAAWRVSPVSLYLIDLQCSTASLGRTPLASCQRLPLARASAGLGCRGKPPNRQSYGRRSLAMPGDRQLTPRTTCLVRRTTERRGSGSQLTGRTPLHTFRAR